MLVSALSSRSNHVYSIEGVARSYLNPHTRMAPFLGLLASTFARRHPHGVRRKYPYSSALRLELLHSHPRSEAALSQQRHIHRTLFGALENLCDFFRGDELCISFALERTTCHGCFDGWRHRYIDLSSI